MESSIKERESPRLDIKYWATRRFAYGPEGQPSTQLSRGQIFVLDDQCPNNALLVDLGYVNKVPKGQTTYPCRECGAIFVDMRMRDDHGLEEHETREYVPPPPPIRNSNESQDMYQNRLDEWAQQAGRESDRRLIQRDKKEDEVAPIKMENTAASRKG